MVLGSWTTRTVPYGPPITYVAGNDAYSITDKVFHGEARSDDYPEESVGNSESVTEAPELEELDYKSKYKDAGGKDVPLTGFIRADGSADRIDQDDDKDITDIVPDKTVGKNTDQDLDDEENK